MADVEVLMAHAAEQASDRLPMINTKVAIATTAWTDALANCEDAEGNLRTTGSHEVPGLQRTMGAMELAFNIRAFRGEGRMSQR